MASKNPKSDTDFPVNEAPNSADYLWGHADADGALQKYPISALGTPGLPFAYSETEVDTGIEITIASLAVTGTLHYKSFQFEGAQTDEPLPEVLITDSIFYMQGGTFDNDTLELIDITDQLAKGSTNWELTTTKTGDIWLTVWYVRPA